MELYYAAHIKSINMARKSKTKIELGAELQKMVKLARKGINVSDTGSSLTNNIVNRSILSPEFLGKNVPFYT